MNSAPTLLRSLRATSSYSTLHAQLLRCVSNAPLVSNPHPLSHAHMQVDASTAKSTFHTALPTHLPYRRQLQSPSSFHHSSIGQRDYPISSLPTGRSFAPKLTDPHQLAQTLSQCTHRRTFINHREGKSHSERRLLGYTPQQLFDVVADVERYQEFLPWCSHSTIVENLGDGKMDVELEVGFKMLTESYISCVTCKPPELVHSIVTDSSLFSHLESEWQFKQGPSPDSCWLEFKVEFRFRSLIYGEVASIVFEEVMAKMVGAFEERCYRIYGPPSLRSSPRRARAHTTQQSTPV